MNATELSALFDASGTDKGGYHGYADFYAALPSPACMLEIGVYEGASLHAWRELWPDTDLWGLDIDLSRVDQSMANERTHLIQRDSTAWPHPPELPMFDLIVDDGDHRPQKQRATFMLYSPRLKLGGTYVIEDVRYPEQVLPLLGLPFAEIRPGPHFDYSLLYWTRHA